MSDIANLPNIYGISVGHDFSNNFTKGFIERFKNCPPDYTTNITLYVNTNRMAENIKDSFLRLAPGFLPKIYSIADLRHLAIEHPLPDLLNPLEEQLELNELIKKYLEQSPNTAPKSASFDLAYELINLKNEMHSENVSVQKVESLSQADISIHWQQSLKFLNIIFDYWSVEKPKESMESINSKVIYILNKKWAKNPPKYPIIIAGSTGSRGITQTFMKLVAKQRLGFVVLPGFDFNQTKKVWDSFNRTAGFEDHPQYRYYQLINALSIKPENMEKWISSEPNAIIRNNFVSLALRPAPVTDQWLEEGPKLGNLTAVCAGLSLIEASTLREEASAIALCIRKAVEDNKSISLITPDHDLTRQVTAALGRWNLVPDNSAGQPLSSTPPGIFLRQVCNLIGQEVTAENLIPLLKNPLTNTGAQLRGEHLNNVREMEIKLRGGKESYLSILTFLKTQIVKDKTKNNNTLWVNWINKLFQDVENLKTDKLNNFVKNLIDLSENLSNGPTGQQGILWDQNSGELAKKTLNNLILAGEKIHIITCLEFKTIITSILNKEKNRETTNAHPLIKIWGTIDARASTTEITILGSMNDGTWPQITKIDPWLSRSMRKEAGLLSPERKIGLVAHDFQQGISGTQVIISRSKRLNDTPAIPSRWLNRITNLLKGLGEDGSLQLIEMKNRGEFWVNMVKELEAPLKMKGHSQRPSPIPPLMARPRKLSVTQIETLIRDPYSIYARHILKLKKLQPLKQQATPLLKGNIIHKIIFKFSEKTKNDPTKINNGILEALTEKIFNEEVPWPAIRTIWKEQFRKVSPLFLEAEALRRVNTTPLFFEHPGSISFKEIDMTLTAIADRIDEKNSGELIIYDYKSGKPPTLKQINSFHKQLMLEALIAKDGGFKDIPAKHVTLVNYVSLHHVHPNTPKSISPEEIETTRKEFFALINHYKDPKSGYTARLRMEKVGFSSDYDHLSRYGEWDETNIPINLVLK